MYIHVLIKYSSNSTLKKKFGSLSINKSRPILAYFKTMRKCWIKTRMHLNILETNIIEVRL